MVSVVVSPEDALLDEQISIRVTGLDSGEDLAIRVSMAYDGTRYRSTTTFSADEGGIVDTDDHAPVEGSYDEVEPMGIFVWMEPDESGTVDELPTFPSAVLEGVVDGEQVFERTVNRRTRAPGVERSEVDDGDVVGELFQPKGTERRPGVIYLGGSGGGTPPAYRCGLLASRGYTVLGLAYFGVEGRPDQLSEVPVEYVGSASDFLEERRNVDGDRICVVGGSRGAELGLLAASEYPSIDAVVGYVPSGIAWEAVGETAPWTVDGEPHPYLAGEFDDVNDRDGPVRFDRGHERALDAASEEALEVASIPIEEATASILLLSGGDDRLWPSRRLSERLVTRLEECGYEHDFEHRCYEGAGHHINVPYLPVHGRESGGELPDGRTMAYGGSPAAYAAADRDSWERVLSFLDEHLCS